MSTPNDSKNLFVKSLSLQNIATFPNHTIEFSPHFNCIVGETGSGKSLILESLAVALGGKFDRKLLRNGHDFATIEVVFTVSDPNVNTFMGDLGFPCEDEIVIKRSLLESGKNKNWMNFQTCNLNQIRDFSKRFVDIVGQFDNQKLLSPNYQLKLLDHYGHLEERANQFNKHFNDVLELNRIVGEHREKFELLKLQKDYFEFQISQIEELNPSLEDEEGLIRSKEKINLREKFSRSIQQANLLLDGNESQLGIIEQSRALIKSLTVIEKFIDPSAIQFSHQLLDIALSSSQSISLQAENEQDQLSEQEVLDRLDLYARLKRKFGGSTETILEVKDQMSTQLTELESLASKIAKIEAQIASEKETLWSLANELHVDRNKAALSLSKKLGQSLRKLNMPDAKFDLQCHLQEEFHARGATTVKFFVQTNIGEGHHLISEIASGGELSRILLSVREILSASDSISVFLFDEIDAGIGGKTAINIGESLKSVSISGQVISITHLPQIAQFADRILKVEKKKIIQKGSPRTISEVSTLPHSGKKDFQETFALFSARGEQI